MPYHLKKDGRNTYFIQEENGQSSWILPSNEMEQLVPSPLPFFLSSHQVHYYESTLLGETETGSDSSNVFVGVVQDEAERISKELKNVEEENELLKDRWIVKLHPDCGLVYYTDSLSELSSWTNPFEPGLDNEIFEKINLEVEHKPPPLEEAEKLAGYDDVPNREVFNSNYVQSSRSRLSNWIQKEHLRVLDDYAAMLNYPEYLCVNPTALTDTSPFQVILRLPKGLSGDPSTDNFASSTTKLLLCDTVGKMMEGLFKKYLHLNGRPLDEAGTDGYVFKVVGFHEYMLHMDFPLGYYECVVNACRDKVS
jgi:hypothetical protein